MSTQQPAPPIYQIRVKEQLNKQWGCWFGALNIQVDQDGTLLTGPVVDQAALFGILRKVRDAGLTLISINCLTGGF
ncbi:MAG: hypothetical protein H6653_07635 [Ardenticatenaceae bacterium]|nr:hypothetical protein [Ardenticatenaceae bacterium]